MIKQVQLNDSDLVNNTNVKRISIQKIVFCLIGFMFTILTIDTNAVSGYKLQFLLPLFFTLFYFLFAPSINRLGIGYLLLNGIWLIRYCIEPLCIKLSNYQIRYYSDVSDHHLNIALILMIIELCVSIISSGYFCKRIITKMQKKNDSIHNVSFKAVFILIVFSAIVIVFDRNALYSFNFILKEQFVKVNASLGISILILSWCKMVLTVFLLGKLSQKNSKNPNEIYLFCSIFLVIFSISIFSGMSRNSLLVEALAYIYLLVRLFPKHKKQIYIINFSALFLILLTITMYRFYSTRILKASLEIFEINTLSHLLNVYFAGQQNVAIGLRSIELYGQEYNFFTLMKDLFANTVLLNKLVAGITGTVEIYNYTVYGHKLWADQIPPTITQAIALFNIFGFIVPVIITYFIVRMDINAKIWNSTLGIFIAALIASNLAFFIPGNITILSTGLMNKFIPLYFIYKFSEIKIIRMKLNYL